MSNLHLKVLCLFILLTGTLAQEHEDVSIIQSEDSCPVAIRVAKCRCEAVELGNIFECLNVNWNDLKVLLTNYANADINMDFFLHINGFTGDLPKTAEEIGESLHALKHQMRSLSISRAPDIEILPDLSWAVGLRELSLDGLPALSNWDFKSNILPANLEQLYLGSTRLTKITYEMLEGLANLTVLEFVGHAAIELIGEPFIDLSNLKELAIVGGLSDLPENSTEGLGNLRELNLSSNSLRNITADAFSGMNHLKALDLSNNSLEDLPIGMLQNNTHLLFFSVFWNDLVKLPKHLFNATSNVIELDLSGNYLHNFDDDMFANLKNLTSLNLRDNNIAGFLPGTFDKLKGLHTLQVQENLIRFLPADIFRGLYGLHTLNLSRNYIEWMSKDALRDLTSLQSLDLSRNYLLELPMGVFSHQPNSWTLLHINSNRIKTVDIQVLSGKNITNIDFTDNAFTCSCKNLPFATYLQNYYASSQHHLQCVDPEDYKIYKLLQLNSLSCVTDTHKFMSTGLEAMLFVGTVLFFVILIVAVGMACAMGQRTSSPWTFYPSGECSKPEYSSDVQFKGVKTDTITTVL